MNQGSAITDMFVTLNSGVRLRVQASAHESADSQYFDEDTAIARKADHLEIMEAAALISAGQAERWHGPKTTHTPDA